MTWSRGSARVNRVMHVAFYVLLVASAVRLLLRHGVADGYVLMALALAAALAVAYGLTLTRVRRTGLVILVILGLALVLWAPSFSWCAIPLYLLCLRGLPRRQALGVGVLLTATTIIALVRSTDSFDPSLILGPIVIAMLTTAVLLELERTGKLEERERLAQEIHDTLAQGLSSMQMMLQAADRVWDRDPGKARDLVNQAAGTAGRGLEEARRFIADLQPIDLVTGTFEQALARICAANGADFEVSGTPYTIPAAKRAALLRIMQQALANVAAHARAGRVAVTLTYLPGQVALDIRDDGIGFDPESVVPTRGRGYGLTAMRRRVERHGGTLVIESTPGEGTAIAAAIPVEET